MTPRELQPLFEAWAKKNLPLRTRMEVDCSGRVDLFCSGRTRWTAYLCELPPDHAGRCLTKRKGCLEFTPENF